jgi:hypothetical protein
MAWKNTLNPTRWKIVFTLIVVAIGESMIYAVGATSILCEPCPPPPAACPPCVAPEIGLTWALIALAPVSAIAYLVTCLVARVLRHD